jgi:hypothetical protein
MQHGPAYGLLDAVEGYERRISKTWDSFGSELNDILSEEESTWRLMEGEFVLLDSVFVHENIAARIAGHGTVRSGPRGCRSRAVDVGRLALGSPAPIHPLLLACEDRRYNFGFLKLGSKKVPGGLNPPDSTLNISRPDFRNKTIRYRRPSRGGLR